MEPESLGTEESELQELESGGRPRDVADVLTLEEIANLAPKKGNQLRR